MLTLANQIWAVITDDLMWSRALIGWGPIFIWVQITTTQSDRKIFTFLSSYMSLVYTSQQARVGPVTSWLGPDQVKPRLVLIRSKTSPDLNQDVGKRRHNDVIMTSSGDSPDVQDKAGSQHIWGWFPGRRQKDVARTSFPDGLVQVRWCFGPDQD